MFGKRKVPELPPKPDLEVELEQPEEVKVEEEEEEVMVEEEPEPTVKPKSSSFPTSKNLPKPVVKPAEEPKPEPKEVKPVAQIVSGELLESGLHRYILLTNKELGHIGELLPLD